MRAEIVGLFSSWLLVTHSLQVLDQCLTADKSHPSLGVLRKYTGSVTSTHICSRASTCTLAEISYRLSVQHPHLQPCRHLHLGREQRHHTLAGPPTFWAPVTALLAVMFWRTGVRDATGSNAPPRAPDRFFMLAFFLLVTFLELSVLSMHPSVFTRPSLAPALPLAALLEWYMAQPAFQLACPTHCCSLSSSWA